MTWLGITSDLRAKLFHISKNRIESILNTLNNLNSTPHVIARRVTQIIGKIISTIFVLGIIVRLKTRNFDKSVLTQTSWD